MTKDVTDQTHQRVVDLLPEAALALLPLEDAEAVREHLDDCSACRQEFADLQYTATRLAYAAPPAAPSPRVKEALLARLGAPGSAPGPAPPENTVVTPARRPARRFRAGRGERRDWWRWGMAVAAVVVASLLGWNILLQRELATTRTALATTEARAAEQAELTRLLSDPSAAHSLTGGDGAPRAVGYIYALPDSRLALVLAYRMPPLPAGQAYQIWLIHPDGTRDSGGLFTVDSAGNGHLLIQAPAPFGTYRAVGVTAEPWPGSPAPTSPRVIGGAIQ